MPERAQPKKRQDNPRSLLRTAALAALVLAAAVLPYARTLDFDFVWDDHYTVGRHLQVHGVSDVARIWSLPFDSLLNDAALKRTYFRPATLYSLALDWAGSPENPRAFHRTNVFLYAAACLFLWLLAWELSGRPVAAAAGAVLYALHPAHPESVAFISGRTDVLSGLFLFASLWAAARFGPALRSSWMKLAPAALLYIPSLYAKEIALFAAPLIPAALWVRERGLPARGLLRASLPVGAAAALYLATRIAVLQSAPLPAVTPVEGTLAQILTSVAVVARYVPLVLVPAALSARHEIVETHRPDLVFAAGLLILAALAAGIVAAARRRSPWILPLGLYATTLLPVCYVRLLSGAIVAERFLFIPSGAIALAVALWPGSIPARREGASERGGSGTRDAGTMFLLTAAAVALGFLVLVLPRIALWKSDGTLFLSMLRDSPESPHVHAILGGYYYGNRDLPRAAYHYRRAFQLRPQSTELLLNLGAAEDEMGQSDSAFAHIRLLNRLEPRYGPGLYALGNLYVRIDQPDSAAAAYRASLERMPRFPQAENNLGAVLERQGHFDEALQHYRRALAVDPGYKEARNNYTRLTAERAGRR
jgi:tetratricopeptide (TPR) repeat protein